jgi:uncharacterized repeat protein (TIGR03987 family)
MLFIAILFISFACLFHLVVFWLGFICDTIGTGAMGEIAGSFVQINFHGLTGLVAILLMLFHAAWATKVLIQKDEKMIVNFHKFSIVVWIIWLIPMITGMILGSNV